MTQDFNSHVRQEFFNQPPIINDFCITFSTVNGSGSATANTTLMRTLFRMGIPVSGKNIFPSNIQGLPTWYTLRVNKNGYLSRVETDDIVIAMNPSTIEKEGSYLSSGGVLMHPDDIKYVPNRDDIFVYPMPVKKIIKETEVSPNLRDYVANMVYVGVLSNILGIDLENIREALKFHFKNKEKPVEINMSVISRAYQWAVENIEKVDPYRVEPMNKTEGWIMADGNTAGAIGALYGGVQFTAWYPITPASSLAESLQEYAPLLRKDPETGRETSVVVQAEDELAAIGMAIGAGWAGLRSMTSTSGPGLSLMTEYLGLAYYSEVPVVLWDVQRVGPSTGLPTRTAQGDLTFVYFLGHGDTDLVMLIPGSVNECFEFGWKAFDIAERLQTPVVVMSDLDLGMNEWMTPKFDYPDKPIDRGKILWEEDLVAFLEKNNGVFGRYKDVDGDFIPYRTVAGNRHKSAAYFTRGTGHDEFAKYTEDPEIWVKSLDRLKKKYKSAVNYTPKPVIEDQGNSIGIITSGSAHFPVEEARDLLEAKGLHTDYLRIRSLPLHQEVNEFIARHDRIYIVEMNRDGQLKQIITLDMPEYALKLRQVAKVDGLPLSAKWIVNEIISQEEK
ncbi:MAG: 2-oxoacid:acceptor oxidoreductase subunit alpha [Chloroflexi bacterium HGW-Chloroflexi-10]|nr:MAG: 2-oxoacid:acceptor oxidoreductase subunit alpha [Chloroflexi bacterium HGW-Chloroflexi-10]